jgi:hypothetical protein
MTPHKSTGAKEPSYSLKYIKMTRIVEPLSFSYKIGKKIGWGGAKSNRKHLFSLPFTIPVQIIGNKTGNITLHMPSISFSH